MRPSSPVGHPVFESHSKILNGFREGVLVVDERGSIALANDRVAEQLGYTTDALLQTLLFTVNPHLTLLSWKKKWKGLQRGETLREETEFMHLDGALLPVRIAIRPVELEGKCWAMMTVEFLLDTLRYPHLLHAATETGEICSWELNLVTRMVFLEGEILRLLDLPEDQHTFPAKEIGQVFARRVSDTDLGRLQEAVERLIKGQDDTFEMEVVLDHPGGSFDRLTVTAIAYRSISATSKIYGTVSSAFHADAPEETSFLSRFTIDHVSDLIFWVRPDGSFAYVNQAVCDSLGYSRKELLEMNARQVAHDFDDAELEALWKVLRRDKHAEGKYELIKRSGEHLPILASSNYLVYEGEEFNCSVAKDVTRQEAENYQLRLTQFTIENAHEMILWVHTDGTVFYANDTFTEKTGYHVSDRIALNFTELFTDDYLVRQQENAWSELQSLEEFDIETTLICEDGRQIPVYCTFNYLRYEDKVFICIYIRDWRRKKKRDMQIFWAQNALDSALDMIFWIDEDIRIAYQNKAAAEKLGYQADQLKHFSLDQLCADLDPSKLPGKDETAQYETRFKTSSGETIPVEVSISSAYLRGKYYSCLIARDIKKRKANEAKLLEHQKKIEELSLKLKDENILLREEIYSNYNFNNIITQNKRYRNVLGQIAQVADSNATVLITGETGTGKELLARAIYSLSDREDQPFIKVNCAALPKNLIESELFGHEKGAFTGAVSQKKGRFELADKGTIFLDEIGELPLDLQAKLLRVLQEGEFERLGGTTTLQVDARIVAATNRNLEKMVEQGEFREDLYYRLNVFPIVNPPLRERKEDIPLLVRHFAKKYGKKMGKHIKKISESDIRELQRYDFPGNVRELENIVERAMILAQGGVLNLKASFDLVRETAPKGKSKFLTFEEMQKKHIVEALKKCNMRVTGPKGAARILDLNDRTLMSKMRKLGIKREDYF